MALREPNAKKHKYSPEDRLFLDANIWLHVFGPQGSSQDQRSKSYSIALKRALNANSNIYIDVLVMSEYLNRSLRYHFDEAGLPGGNFKKYRDTHEYEAAVRAVTSQAKQFLRHCKLVESDFTQCDPMQMMTDFAQTPSDFNDEIIIKLCCRHGFTLMTDDGDFINSGLNILSCNSAYLSRASNFTTNSD